MTKDTKFVDTVDIQFEHYTDNYGNKRIMCYAVCPKCGKEIMKILNRNDYFICSKCNYKYNVRAQ